MKNSIERGVNVANLISLSKVSLKNHSEIKEDIIQNYIFDNPDVLGLGELVSIRREKIQPTGGRLDMVMSSSDSETRYEIEIMLGATDPSHIIRTIEYWDNERKRYPQYDHCAVIIAEEITGRFMNVINLFNGAIPLIALQMSAYEVGGNISLTFTKVIDRITYGSDEEDEYEVTDRNYWEKKSSKKVMKEIDEIFKDMGNYISNYELKYNKFYIGLSKGGIVKNFIIFRPRQQYLYMIVKANEDSKLSKEIEESGLDTSYSSRENGYKIKLTGYDEYKKHEKIVRSLVEDAMEHFNISEM